MTTINVSKIVRKAPKLSELKGFSYERLMASKVSLLILVLR